MTIFIGPVFRKIEKWPISNHYQQVHQVQRHRVHATGAEGQGQNRGSPLLVGKQDSEPGQLFHLRPVQTLHWAGSLQKHCQTPWLPRHRCGLGRVADRDEDPRPRKHPRADEETDNHVETGMQARSVFDNLVWDPRESSGQCGECDGLPAHQD